MGSRSVIPVIRRLEFEEHDLEDSLGYIMRCYFKNKKKGSIYGCPVTPPSSGMFFLKTKQEKNP